MEGVEQEEASRAPCCSCRETEPQGDTPHPDMARGVLATVTCNPPQWLEWPFLQVTGLSGWQWLRWIQWLLSLSELNSIIFHAHLGFADLDLHPRGK